MSVPTHVAIVMDGNGRWAQSRGLPRVAGHKAGVESVRCAVRRCMDLNIRYLTIFAFSTENWKRSALEVSALKRLFILSLAKEVKALHAQGVRMRFIGDLSAFSARMQTAIQQAEALTCANQRLDFIIAFNYGGQWDICQAAKKIALRVQAGELAVADINTEQFSQVLATAGIPDPELYIRTSGEQRISNFLLWQLAYSELYFCDTFWPDFNEVEWDKAMQWYQSRQRRFGGVT